MINVAGNRNFVTFLTFCSRLPLRTHCEHHDSEDAHVVLDVQGPWGDKNAAGVRQVLLLHGLTVGVQFPRRQLEARQRDGQELQSRPARLARRTGNFAIKISTKSGTSDHVVPSKTWKSIVHPKVAHFGWPFWPVIIGPIRFFWLTLPGNTSIC